MLASEVFKLKQRENLYIIGLMGGIAAGKSKISSIFAELGGTIICADDMVHKVLEDMQIQNEIAKQWGQHLIQNNQVDKQALANLVFSSPEELKKLEEIIHPVIRRGVHEQLQAIANVKKQVVVLDIALLLERGLHQGCDLLIFIDVPFELRKQRTIENRNWTPSELEKRESHQLDLSIKKNAANVIIKNENLQDTYSQIRQIWSEIEF